MRSGRAIAGEHEQAESNSERERVRRRARRKKTMAVIIVAALILAIGFMGVLAIKEIMNSVQSENVVRKKYEPTIDMYDENGFGEISGGVREYIGKVEEDLRELGYSAMRAVLPVGTVREVDFYVEGFSGYIKTNTDRDAAETAEDAGRMIKYLVEREIQAAYIDVRVAGKGFYK